MCRFADDVHAALSTRAIHQFETRLREESHCKVHPKALTTATEAMQSKQQKMGSLMTNQGNRRAVRVELLRRALHRGIEVMEP